MGVNNIKVVSVDTVWKLRQEVMYPNNSIDFVKLEHDLDGVHWGLYLDEDVVSVLSVFYHNDKVQFRKFCTRAPLQGLGYGTALLTHFFEQVKLQNQYRVVWCNARIGAASFYKKFGMHLTDKTYSKNGYDYVVMECEI